MRNNHNVEVYDNGHGYRIALEIYTGTRMSMTVEAAQKLKESLEYGLAKTSPNIALETYQRR